MCVCARVVQQAQNSDNAPGVYSGGSQFKSQPRYRKYLPILVALLISHVGHDSFRTEAVMTYITTSLHAFKLKGLPPWQPGVNQKDEINFIIIIIIIIILCRSLWSRHLRCGYAGARLLELRVRSPPGIWRLSRVSFVWCQVEKGLCAGLITRPEESHRVWCVWVWSSTMRRPWPSRAIAPW